MTAPPPGSIGSGAAPGPRPADPTAPSWRTALVDAGAMSGRSLRRSTRELDVLLLSVLLPVMLMLLFVHVFGGALGLAVEGTAYVDYVVPGVVLLCAGYGAAQTAVSVAGDLSTGVIDRFRSLPVWHPSVLVGHVAASMARNAVATVAVVLVALAAGFRPAAGPVGWLAAAGLVALYVLALSWVSLCIGLVAGGVEAASGFTFVVLFLPYLSSAFVPTATMPTALRVFSEHQPVTPVIETLRAVLLDAQGGRPGEAVLWCLGLLLLAVLMCGPLFRRSRRR